MKQKQLLLENLENVAKRLGASRLAVEYETNKNKIERLIRAFLNGIYRFSDAIAEGFGDTVNTIAYYYLQRECLKILDYLHRECLELLEE